jgi:hypothetical protein
MKEVDEYLGKKRETTKSKCDNRSNNLKGQSCVIFKPFCETGCWVTPGEEMLPDLNFLLGFLGLHFEFSLFEMVNVKGTFSSR